MIHRDRVLLLSRVSDELHCLEATSGKLAWRVPRGDAVYIGAVTDDRIVLVGEREVRAIAMPADGTQTVDAVEPMWSHVVGPVTGRGVRAGEDFLVPLKSGRVACLELTTGRDRGFAVTRTFDPAAIRRRASQQTDEDDDDQELAPWPGNLIACDDVVVSLGLSHLAVYPQAHSCNTRVLPRAWLATSELVVTEEDELSIMRTGNCDTGVRVCAAASA